MGRPPNGRDVKIRLVGVLLAALMLAGAAAQAQDQEGSSIIEMFDSFTVSLVATTKCAPPDDYTLEFFVRNLLIVQGQALAHYQREFAGVPAEQVQAMLNDRVAVVGAQVEEAIAAKGCNHPDIGKLVRLFDINARPDLLVQ